jgi:hypothetical protein
VDDDDDEEEEEEAGVESGVNDIDKWEGIPKHFMEVCSIQDLHCTLGNK